MYCVFWMYPDEKWGGLRPCCQLEPELMAAVKLCETLRSDPEVRFVTMTMEDPNNVGKMGVADVGPDYNWTKRRVIATGRKKANDDNPS